MIFDNIVYIDEREKNHGNRAASFWRRLHDDTHKEITKGYFKGYSSIKATGTDVFRYKSVNPTILSVGDYSYNGYVFEYKTAINLQIDIQSGHMKTQIDNAQKALINKEINRYCVICEDKHNYLSFNDKNYFSNKFSKNIDFISLNSQKECFNFMINAWLDDNPIYNDTLIEVEPFNMALNALKPLLTKTQLTKLYKQHPLFSLQDIMDLNKTDYQKALGRKTGEYVYNRIHVKVNGGK